MLPSMYSAISGLKANQKKLDVIGNNIANVSTTGFKVQRMVFQDMLSQTLGQATGAGGTTGGTNPKQIGLGVQIGSIDTLTSTGNMQSTGRSLDAAIDGKGYFMVGRGTTPATNADGVAVDPTTHIITGSTGMSVMFTRDGSFTLDDYGNLVTSDGNRVLGYALTGTAGGTAAGTAGTLTGTAVVGAAPGAGNFVFSVDGGALKTAAILSGDNEAAVIASINSAAGSTIAADDGSGHIKLTSGTTGTTSKITVDGTSTPAILTYLGFTSGATNTGTLGGASTGTSINYTAGVPTLNYVDADTAKAGTTLVPLVIPDTVTVGSDTKRVKSFSIEKDGLIKAVLDDGSVTALGQIAISSFKNEGGLTKLGKNLYQNSANSGDAVVRSGTGATTNNGNGYGDILQNVLEMSNVDLAEQFTDMIVASRAFQANGKMITTGDEILQDLVNLKR